MTALHAILRFIASVACVSGVLLLVDVGLTLAWQEPISALTAARSQAAAEDQLAREMAAFERERGASTADSAALRDAARRYRRRLRTGRAIGRISLPSLKRQYVMVQGTDTEPLRKGPGHYPETPLPGQGGTIGIAGHRTTYLAPFRTIDRLRRGQPIVVTMPYGRFTYRVRRTRIVLPSDVWVKRPVGYEQLILSACHPLYSAAKRIVVFARLVGAEPLNGRTDSILGDGDITSRSSVVQATRGLPSSVDVTSP